GRHFHAPKTMIGGAAPGSTCHDGPAPPTRPDAPPRGSYRHAHHGSALPAPEDLSQAPPLTPALGPHSIGEALHESPSLKWTTSVTGCRQPDPRAAALAELHRRNLSDHYRAVRTVWQRYASSALIRPRVGRARKAVRRQGLVRR